MNWRWVWLRAHLTAIAASALVWLVVATLAPRVIGVVAFVGVALVVGWRSRPVLWWRFGVRPAGPDVSTAVWRALVPVEWLRGRNQPRLWTSLRLEREAVAPGPRDLELSEQLLHRVSQGQLGDGDLCRLAVRALALAEVNQSRLVAAVGIFCLPWWLIALAARVSRRPLAAKRLTGFAWNLRWLFVGVAAADLYVRAHWPGLLMLLLIATATVTTPRWNRAWSQRQTAMADAAEQRLAASRSGLVQSASANSPAVERSARRVPGPRSPK